MMIPMSNTTILFLFAPASALNLQLHQLRPPAGGCHDAFIKKSGRIRNCPFAGMFLSDQEVMLPSEAIAAFSSSVSDSPTFRLHATV